MMTYRPDVDGLRAVAILSVVLYHASEPAMSGGFTGVDVFFVISGYLITRLIAAEIDQGRFSIAAFYVRRTKRIFPALFVVLFTTLGLGAWLLTPTELASLGRSMAATAAFVSNIAFWQDTGYFDVAAEGKPLLHTWSLAVEEQFYVFWPLLLLLLARLRMHVRYVVPAVFALSFAISAYASYVHPPSAFFLLPGRAWELLTGAALALGLVPVPRTESMRTMTAAAGLASIGLGFVLFDRTTVFPGWAALLPVGGAALIIAAGEHGSHAVSRRLLATRPMVFVGLISYSFYLWHWPLLVLARVTMRGHLPPGVALAVVAAAFGLSVLTWKFVEQPLRAKGITVRAAPVLLRYAVVSLAAFAAGAITHQTRGFVRFAPEVIVRTEEARYDINPLSRRCLQWQGQTGELPGSECMTGAETSGRRVAIWGDSHADSVAPGLASYASARGYATHQLTMAACPPLADVVVDGPGVNYAACAEFNRRVMEYVTTDPAVTAVVLTARWSLYTENARFGDDPGPITYLVDDLERELSPAASKRAFTRALAGTIAAIRAAGKAVVVLGTVPPLGTNIPECLARNHMPLSGVRDCAAPADRVLPYLAFADAEIERLTANRAGVCSFMPKQVLCRDGRCLDTWRDEILYANDDHLSAQGAAYLAEFLELERCLPPAPTRSDIAVGGGTMSRRGGRGPGTERVMGE